MRVLVIGGAGYIGSHMLKRLGAAGCEAVTLDDLSTGWRRAITFGKFVKGDMGDRDLLNDLFSSAGFDCVMHFAAHSQIRESVENPAKYYRNNVAKTLALLDENHPRNPINPYGRSKLMIEDILRDYDLCDAHLLALLALDNGAPSAAYNLGNGNGFSVREVIAAAKTVTGAEIPAAFEARRPGDPARLVSDSARARAELGWSPRHPELETIVSHAWKWELTLRARETAVNTP